MLKVEVDLTPALDALDNLPPEVANAVRNKVLQLTSRLQHHIVADKLQGQVLHHRSGALGRSIQMKTYESENTFTGEVYSTGDVKYAGIHEFGGVIPAHDIFPKNAEALAFMMDGKQVFAKVVHMPDVTMPERSFMRSSLADMADTIVKEIKEAALLGAKNAMGE